MGRDNRAKPAHLPEPGRDAPEALVATSLSSDVALAASGSDARVVETVPPPSPAQERRATFERCYGSVLGYHTVAHDPEAARAHDLQCDDGRVGAATLQRLSVPRRTVAAVGALRGRCMLLVLWYVVTMALGSSRASARRACTHGAQWPRVTETGANRVLVEVDIGAAFPPVTAARVPSRVLGKNPQPPHRRGRAPARLHAADPHGILRALGVARVAPGVGLCAH